MRLANKRQAERVAKAIAKAFGYEASAAKDFVYGWVVMVPVGQELDLDYWLADSMAVPADMYAECIGDGAIALVYHDA